MLTLAERLQGSLLGAVLGERWGEPPWDAWVWQPQKPGIWGQYLYQGCAYWGGRPVQVPPAQTVAEALVLVLPGLTLCYPQMERVTEVVVTAGLPSVVGDWALVLGQALQGQVGEPLADSTSWADLAVSVGDFTLAPDDPVTALTWGVRQGRSPLALFLTGYLLGAYGGARAFPSGWVVSRLADRDWLSLGTALFTRWAGVRQGQAPWAVAPITGSG
ncbi:hypothetical protein LQF76_14110 [Gloeomargaritales cyanobacterium VI4D9]|nr:hypothetical protein LQF76_14110 [Gloeomargaritales cyanobacterium VI4D9]